MSCKVSACWVVFDFHSEAADVWSPVRLSTLDEFHSFVRSRHGRGRGGGRVGGWVSGEVNIPEPLKLKRKWCHPCPDYHDSLVSGCALMLPYIWASGSCNCLGSATGTHLGHFTSLNTHFHVFLPAWETGQGFDHAEFKLCSLSLSKHVLVPC